MATIKPAANRIVMAPVPATVAKLLHKLNAEIIMLRDAEPPPEPLPADAIVLRGAGQQRARWSGDAFAWLYLDECTAGHYFRARGNARLAPWVCVEELRDQAGREWTRQWNAAVDDFGDLVEVPGLWDDELH